MQNTSIPENFTTVVSVVMENAEMSDSMLRYLIAVRASRREPHARIARN